MDGMIYHWNYVHNSDGVSSTSDHVEIPPTATIGQITISGNYDHTDPNLCEASFISCEFIDGNGVQRTRQLGVNSFSQNGLVRVDFQLVVDSGASGDVMNLFFWQSVS